MAAGILVLAFGLSTLALAQGGAQASDKKPSPGFAPDPPPLKDSRQWQLTFRYDQGKIALTNARRIQLRTVRATPRQMGRYAIELLSGPTLVDRLRFDFPLLGADEVAGRPKGYNDPPRFEPKAQVSYVALIPDSDRISRARLVDRATGQTQMLRWPPVPEPVVLDAGVWDSSNEASWDVYNREASLPEASAEGGVDAAPDRSLPRDASFRDVFVKPDAPHAPDATPLP